MNDNILSNEFVLFLNEIWKVVATHHTLMYAMLILCSRVDRKGNASQSKPGFIKY